MKTKYQQVMDHITVTEEEKERVIDQIDESMDEDLDDEDGIIPSGETLRRLRSISDPKGRKRRQSIRMASYLAVAAVLALVVISQTMSLSLVTQLFTKDDKPDTTIRSHGDEEFRAVSSEENLGNTVGYSLNLPKKLPFEVEETTYSASKDIAKVDYIGKKGEQLVFWQNPNPKEDTDLTDDYSQSKTISNNGCSVIILGDRDGEYEAAYWNDGTYEYLIEMLPSMSEKEWIEFFKHNY